MVPLLGAGQVDWRFHVALVLAHETGHRIRAIRELRWSDIDFEERLVQWRGDTEKTGYGHTTPLTKEAMNVLRKARIWNPGIGESPVLPAPKDPTQPVGRYVARHWWRKAIKLAGLEPKQGRGWHSLRRKFATDLMDQPLKVVCLLGGWRDHDTLLSCYQRPDESTMRTALEARG